VKTLFISCWFVLATILSFGQADLASIRKIRDFHFPKEILVWNIDNLGNIYAIQNEVIVKFDSTGKQTFSQSIKSLGRISEIEPINSMKIVLFSEEQQNICFLDNTLSLNGNCKNFEEFDVKNAKLIATSNRPNLIWVFDEYRSTILLIDVVKDQIIQRVENLKGILNESSEFVDLMEKDNFLYLTTSNGVVYQFGQMLSETGVQLANYSKFIDEKQNIIIFMSNDQLTTLNLKSNETIIYNCPEKNVTEFKIQGDFLYFRSERIISKYSVK
jgi:hypothetical protein